MAHSSKVPVLATGVYHMPAQYFVDHFGVDPRKVGFGPFRAWRLVVVNVGPVVSYGGYRNHRAMYTLEVVTRDLAQFPDFAAGHHAIQNYMATLDDGRRAACASGLFHYGMDAITNDANDDTHNPYDSECDDLGTVVYIFVREVDINTGVIADRV